MLRWLRWFRRDPQPEKRTKKYPCHFCNEYFKRSELRITHTLIGPFGMTYSVWACSTPTCLNKGESL